MAVIVEVPDASTSRLARRLIGRRSGVSVHVADTEGAGAGDSTRSSGSANRSSGEDRRIVVGSPISEEGGVGHLSLLRQGIWAVVPAGADSINQLLRGYVDDVRSGLCPLLSEITRDQSEVRQLIESVKRRPRTRSGRSGSDAENPLSEREKQILQRISRGVTSREIAGEMGFQLQTVKNKVTAILTKTHARTRTHAVAIALSRGWISAP